MSELRRRMEQDMLVRGMAEKTRVAYISAAAGLAQHYRRSPEAITARGFVNRCVNEIRRPLPFRSS
jgi:hypothetical protein